jgi:membrane-bound metal-dependent hydrolase YbcI (DUF457 family)
MKGIAHFLTGMAVASFFPELVHSASQNLSFGLVLGGIAGLLPDTLDFKVTRYFAPMDDEIDPAAILDDNNQPDPQAIALRIASAMDRAYDTGRPVRVQLHTVRLGADLWRQWHVLFDLEHSEVRVSIGPAVTTAQVPLAGSEIPNMVPGRVPVKAPILPTYDAETTIDIFSGPSLAFERDAEGIKVTFVPWHRAWSHSLLMALLLGALGYALSPALGLAMALATLAHIAADQMGFMGCNAFFPVTRERTKGLGLFRSGDPLPNLFAVWLSLAVLLLNLDRFSAAPQLPLVPYLLAVIAAPCLLFVGLHLWRARQAPHESQPVLAAVEALDETAEVDI